MKQTSLFLCLIFAFANNLRAQTELQHAVYHELGGDAFDSGIGYDVRGGFGTTKFGWSAHATLNSGIFSPINFWGSYAPISLGSSLLFGKTHSLEVGLGLRPRLHSVVKIVPSAIPEQYDVIFYNNVSMDFLPMIGYRFQPKDKYFFC